VDPRQRIYFEAPDRLEFEAEVVACTARDDGFDVRLDRTAFYPTSGGQPHDTGSLGEAHVHDVTEAADGTVVHRCDVALAGRVTGRVDAGRRRDHMQQHSGQHLLSATCAAVAGRPTLAFHLGAEHCTIDVPGPRFEPAELIALEARANAIVREARPVRARFVSAEEAAALGADLAAIAAPVRLVEIEDWDRNPCCGTHVQRTSDIGVIKILAQERAGDTTRLTFVCGERALAAFERAHSVLAALTRVLGRPAEQLAASIAELQSQSKMQRKELESLHTAWADAAAAGWVSQAPRAAGIAIVAIELPHERSLAHAAAAITARGAIALLGRGGARAELLFQRPATVEVDLRPILQAACMTIDGRGGGMPSRAQGAGMRVEALGAALVAAGAAMERGLDASF
jgi:alanyl-tRNA synthetase